MRLAVLFSGGKDSTYALYKAMEDKENEVVCLISMISDNKHSYMFHTPNISLVDLQAEALGLPLIKKQTAGIKEKELEDLKVAMYEADQKYDIDGVISGAFASKYQKERIEMICKDLGLQCINPLWGKDPEKLIREMLDNGFEFILSSIAAEGLDETWLGRVLTYEDIDKLVELNKKVGIHIAFEGGEAESLVINGPVFKSKLLIIESEIIMEKEHTGMFKIKKAELR
ncbi:MAG: TIGR00289 family protein [Nanoarchaeota archaeon]|nr:TIGR00289 family protein [Nanoarchaeota archaeon]MBU1321719.1 TIGR00289 family protein [Nanoarchaeota archaeon]MBU1597685.1 TIGR00289 family protein [Nanoarchaeota archaeon]MBU2440753.1 TIGR00289 family protein [Nanoarchaeota archaeon]